MSRKTRASERHASFEPADGLIIQARTNHLLAAIPGDEWPHLSHDLMPVELPLGKVLHESGRALSHVYFPTSAIVSLAYVMENGAPTDIAAIGNEGVVGVELFLGSDTTVQRAVVRSSGAGFRIRAETIKDAFNRSIPVRHLLLRYTQALITQMAQSGVCNRHHSVDQQLCRWLLTILDRRQGGELVMTQELLANMLGVRREGVTEGALRLQEDGLIRYARGRISILDRVALEQRTCDCYATIKNEYDRLLPDKAAT
jgi:CRP-like cAMP-binding protein